MSDATPATRHPQSPDHRADGRFAPGNRAALNRGNPHAAKVMAWRGALADAVTPDDIRAVVLRLVSEAKAGEGWAVRELLDRTIGPSGRAEVEAFTGCAIQINITPAPTPSPSREVVAASEPGDGQRIEGLHAADTIDATATSYGAGGDSCAAVDRPEHENAADRAEGGDHE